MANVTGTSRFLRILAERGTTGLVELVDENLSFNGNHTIQSIGGTLTLGAVTLGGAITGASQNITGLGNLSVGTTVIFEKITLPDSGSFIGWLGETGDQRRWRVGSDFISNGDFGIQTSATAGASPSLTRFYIDPSGNVGIAATSFGTNATKTLAIASGTATTSAPADMIQIYSVDGISGSTTVGIYQEAAIIASTVVASRTVPIVVNGSTLYMLCNTVGS